MNFLFSGMGEIFFDGWNQKMVRGSRKKKEQENEEEKERGYGTKKKTAQGFGTREMKEQRCGTKRIPRMVQQISQFPIREIIFIKLNEFFLAN